jgi:thioredoxin-related protein
VGLLSGSILWGAERAEDKLWTTKFEDAKAQAKAENKLLLVDFTGSDWCTWCIRLREEVFAKEPFLKDAPKKFVLVELDFPRQKELPPELKEQNEKIAKQFKVRGFPTVLMLDAAGQLIAKTGYRPGGPEQYVKHLTEFVTLYDGIVKMRRELDAAKGLDRAKLLDQLVEGYTKLENEIDELKAWSEEIVTLDPDNAAGLKAKHQFRLLLAEADQLKQARKFDEAKLVYDKALSLPGIGGEQKQDALFAQGECFFSLKDFVGVVACLKKAAEAAPDSPKAANLQGMIQRFAPMGEAQEACGKIKEQLAQAQGLDRAKLLDQLIDARAKLARFAPDQELDQDREKWSQEIIALDPENKAGLKAKYETASLLLEAQGLVRAEKFPEAHAALDKALAIPGLAPDQLQEAQLAKGSCYFAQKEFANSIESLKKAQAAAPDSQRVPMLKALIQRSQRELDRQQAKDQPQPKAPTKPEAK